MNGQLMVCNSSQTGWDVKATCGSQELCDAAKKACLTCVPGQYRCRPSDPRILERCKADGQGWDMVKNCALPLLCSATLGDCILGGTDGGT